MFLDDFPDIFEENSVRKGFAEYSQERDDERTNEISQNDGKHSRNVVSSSIKRKKSK